MSATDNSGGTSSLTIVAVPSLSVIIPLLGLARVTLKFSSSSSILSPMTTTEIVLEVSPGLKVNVPLAAVKSSPAVAVLLAVA